MLRIPVAVLVSLLALAAAGQTASPYVGQTSRPIKALSDEETADYLAGRGMGFAKAAELNGYPGPAHVLELGEALGLSAAQRQSTVMIFEHMQARARAVGARVIDAERRLDRSFATRAISPPLLHQDVESIARAQGELREIHLAAHLEQAGVLSAAQTRLYWQLRGYDDAAATDHDHHRHLVR